MPTADPTTQESQYFNALKSTTKVRPFSFLSSLPTLYTPLDSEAKKMIDRNHEVHDIFFHDNFHNHLPHHVLANVALGCGKQGNCNFERLWKVYDGYLDKKPAPVEKTDMNEENWKIWLGQRKYYTNYLRFFEGLIERDGLIPVVTKYAFQTDTIPRLISGAVHPLIHIGCGVETLDNAITSEGLAEMCIHGAALKPILDQFEPEPSHPRSLEHILKDIRADRTLDSAVDFKDENKTDSVIAHANMLKYYLNQWSVQATEEDISRKMNELAEYAGLILFASSRPGHPKSPVLDFFLMHVLTSTVSVRELITHISHEQSAVLLRAHYAALITYFVARGRPELTRSYVMTYPVTQSWDELARDAFTKDDAHVPKVVRAMHVGEKDWGSQDDFWRRGAQMCVDVMVRDHGDWSFSGMFDEIWE